jgi:hypothetical protein
MYHPIRGHHVFRQVDQAFPTDVELRLETNGKGRLNLDCVVWVVLATEIINPNAPRSNAVGEIRFYVSEKSRLVKFRNGIITSPPELKDRTVMTLTTNWTQTTESAVSSILAQHRHSIEMGLVQIERRKKHGLDK